MILAWGIRTGHLAGTTERNPETVSAIAGRWTDPVIVIVVAVIPMVGGPFEAKRRLATIGLLLPLAEAIWLVAKTTATIAIYPHRPGGQDIPAVGDRRADVVCPFL